MFNFFTKKSAPEPLFVSTDIHCHVLPGIDDGSPDVNTSIELIEGMKQWGIRRIIASPHVTFGTFPNTPDTVAPAREALQRELDARGIEIELSNSAEYRIDDLFAEQMDKGILMPLPDNYLLIENSFIQEPWNIESLIFELQVKGFRPILAHPERYAYYYAHKSRYKALHDAGLMFQINFLSLAGHYGRNEKRFAEYLIEQGFVDFVGTDLHRHSHIAAISDYLCTKDYKRHRDALANRVLNNRL